jgi:hypothetical protein
MTDTTDIIPAVAIAARRILLTDTKETVAEKLVALDRFAEWLKETRAEVEESASAYIREFGAIEFGTIVYYLGIAKKPPKCTDVPATLESLLVACSGDFGQVCEHLSSGAIKYGAARTTLGEKRFDELFKIEEVEELQSEDAAKYQKRLMKLDKKFLR